MYSGQDGNNVVGPGGVGVGSGAPISSGQGMTPNQPIVSGGGDVVLNNSGDQKSKKGLKWAIGIIVGVLILAGIGVGVMFALKIKKTDRDYFNEFANYLLYGEESDKDIEGDYVWGYRYYAVSLDVMSSDSYADYLENLKLKYDILYESSYEKLKDYNDVFWFFYYSSSYPSISRREILDDRRNGMSETEIVKKVEDYYAPFVESSNETVRLYGEIWQEYLLTGSIDDEYQLPDYEIDVFYDIWKIKENFYD